MTQQMVQPNLFTFDGDAQVSYTTAGMDGQPQFTYQDDTYNLSFSGGEVRTQDSELGTLVSVSLVRTVDTGATIFTLLLPGNNVSSGEMQTFDTIGVITQIVGGMLPHDGAQRTYQTLYLQGTAQVVNS